MNAQPSIHELPERSEPIHVRAETRHHQKSIYVMPLMLTLLVCCTVSDFKTRITVSIVLAISSLLFERMLCAIFLIFEMERYKVLRPQVAMMPLQAFINDAVAEPVLPITVNPWRRIWLLCDLQLQSFCVDFGLRSYVVTGHFHHVSDHLEAVHLNDVRLAYQRAVNLQPDQLWISTSFVDTYQDNSRIRIVWSQEHVRTVQIGLLKLSPEMRHVQSFEHSTRITNVLINGAVCFDVFFGSQWVALARCARADVVGQHAAASLNLNWRGAACLGCSAMAIAPQMGWGSLLSVIMVLAFVCTQTLIHLAGELHSRFGLARP